MKKYLLGIFVVLCGLFLTGCGKETLEKKFCDGIKPAIENYKQSKISYDEFNDEKKSLYNKYCSNETSSFCENIKNEISMYDMEKSTDHNCNKYGEGSVMRQTCEKTNELREQNIKNKVDAKLMEIDCQNALK